MEIQLKLAEHVKNNFIKASDVIEIVASAELQDHLQAAGIEKQIISEYCGCKLLKEIQWCYC